MSNLKTVIILVGLVFVAFVVCLALGYFGVYPFTEVYAFVAGAFTKLDFTDPATLATTGGAGVASAAAVAVPLLSKLSSAKDQVLSTAASAKEQIDGYKEQVNGYKTKLETTAQEYQSKLSDVTKQAETYKTQVEGATGQITDLQSKLQGVTDQNSAFIKNLLAASNGALVVNPLDGKTYSVLKVPPEIHIK